MNAPSRTLPGLARQINAEHAACIASAKDTVTRALEVGRLLVEAKGRIPHGGWAGWIEANCDFGVRQGSNYMRAFHARDQIGSTASDLHGLHSAIAMLTGPKADDAEPAGADAGAWNGSDDGDDEPDDEPDRGDAVAGRDPRIRALAADHRAIPGDVEVLQGDARRILATLPAESMHCVVTSPPYFRIRDYGVDGQIGRERTVRGYVDALVEVFREVGRVLRPDGTLWIVLDDTYARGNKLGIPDSVAKALRRDGWYWRGDIIRAKARMEGDVVLGSCMPGSQKNRPTHSHEHILLFARVPGGYYFDGDGVRAASGAMLRDVWEINTEPSPRPHFAMMPRELARRCIRLGTSEWGCCPRCLAPWRRVVEKKRIPSRLGHGSKVFKHQPGDPYAMHHGDCIGNRDPQRHETIIETVGWEPGCDCGIEATVPARVLDPFGGLATTAGVAVGLKRSATVIELNPEYCDLARRLLASAD